MKEKYQKKIWKDLLDISSESEQGNVLMVSLCKLCEKNIKLSDKPLEEEKGFIIV